MARVIHLEVLDERGVPRARVRLDAFPATIGRGYDADVILDDPYVDARHARLRPNGDGGFVVDDLGSVNGLFAGRRGPRQASLAVHPGDTFRLGRTTLRLCDAAQTVPPALVDREGAGPSLASRLTTPVSLLALAGALAVVSTLTWLGSYERVGSAKVVSDSFPLLFAVAMWAGAWALASRIVTHRFAFLQHMAVAATVATVGVLVSVGTEWLSFFFPSGGAAEAVDTILSLALGVLLLYGHLTLASSLSRRARWRAAAGMTMVVTALVAFMAVAEEDEYSSDLEYTSVLKPVSPRWLRAVSIDDFTSASAKLRAEVDSLADE